MNKLEIREYLTKIYGLSVQKVMTANFAGTYVRAFCGGGWVCLWVLVCVCVWAWVWAGVLGVWADVWVFGCLACVYDNQPFNRPTSTYTYHDHELPYTYCIQAGGNASSGRGPSCGISGQTSRRRT